MNEVFANAQRAQYGQSSEKKTYVLNKNLLIFFNEAEDCQDHKAEEPTEETLTEKTQARKKKKTIDEVAKNLPVEEIVIDLPESKLSCDKCEKDTGIAHIITTKTTPPLMKHSLASPSTVVFQEKLTAFNNKPVQKKEGSRAKALWNKASEVGTENMPISTPISPTVEPPDGVPVFCGQGVVTERRTQSKGG